MDNSIENIWKEAFLDEKNLVIPKINSLYNQKSKYIVDKIKKMFKINLILIVLLAIAMPIIYFFIDALYLGIAASVLLLLTAWYSKKEMGSITNLPKGVNSYEYLKSFDKWLKNCLSKNERILRFTYPLYFLIASGAVLSSWSREQELITKVAQKFPNLTFIGNIPLIAIIATIIGTILMFAFSKKIYQWDVNLVYGSAFNRLEETINEMEKLREDN